MKGAIGKSFQDREQAARVRNLALAKIEDILTKKTKVEKRFYEALILKLAGSVLPRLNEHTGRDGQDLPTPIFPINVSTNNSNEENNETN